MSVQAMTWALDHRQTGPLSAEARLVLVALADYADPAGRAAWPAAGSIAARLGITKRAVRRSLALLELDGLIRRGDQRVTSHIRADRRPVVWNLALDGIQVRIDFTTGRPDDGDAGEVALAGEPYDRHWHGLEPTERVRVSIGLDAMTEASPRQPVDNPARGDAGDTHGVTPASPKPLLEPTYSPPVEKVTEARARDLERSVDARTTSAAGGAVVDAPAILAELEVAAYQSQVRAQRDERDRLTTKALGRPMGRDRAPVRRLGLTDRNCPVCGQPVYRTHRCRSSALTPVVSPIAELRTAARAGALASAAPAQLELELAPVEHGECAVCRRVAALVDEAGELCARCVVAIGRMGPHPHPLEDERPRR